MDVRLIYLLIYVGMYTCTHFSCLDVCLFGTYLRRLCQIVLKVTTLEVRPPPKVRMRVWWDSDWFNFGFIHLLKLFLEI